MRDRLERNKENAMAFYDQVVPETSANDNSMF